jgi:hypothetical protein
MDWNAIERSVHVHALSVLTDNRRQAQRSPEIHIPLSKLETSDSRNYDKELRNNGEPVEKSMDTRQLQVVMNMIASQGEKIELLQRDFDRAVRETKEERDAWMSRVRVAEDISARASASLADALSEKRILEDSISSLASRLARLEAAVVENETAFATKRNFEILRSEILFEAAQARGLAISACTESTDSKRMVLEIVNAFVEHAHFHDLYQLLNSKESDNARYHLTLTLTTCTLPHYSLIPFFPYLRGQCTPHTRRGAPAVPRAGAGGRGRRCCAQSGRCF